MSGVDAEQGGGTESRAPEPSLDPPIEWRIPPSSETDPAKVERALRERIKELNCLYGIIQLAERYPDSMGEFLDAVVRILPPSWQYPETTCARIVFLGEAFESPRFRATRWRQSAPIAMHGEAVGEVSVFYLQSMPPLYEGPFLREERALIDAVAERIGTIAMRHAAEQDLQEINRQLQVERKALQETNTALRTVLARIEDEKRDIQKSIHANVEKVLMPILHALASAVPRNRRGYVDLLRDHLEEITSPFTRQFSRKYDRLTPTELQTCHMIRNGMRTKEIAQARGVSSATVSRHRERIRHKLGLTNSRVNLASHLQTNPD